MNLLVATVMLLVVHFDAAAASGRLPPEGVPSLFGNLPELVLGDRDRGVVFGRVADLAIGPDGSLYVLDSGFAVVHRFGSSQEYLGSFGSSGEGPGEFTLPMSLAVDPNSGHVWIGNLHGRLCEYSADGTVIDDFRFSWPGNRPVHSVAVASSGDLYVASPNVLDHTMVHVFSQRGELLRSFGPTYASDEPGTDPFDEMTYARGFLDVRGQSIYYAQKNPLELRIYDLDGGLQKSIADPRFDVPYPPRVLQPDGTRIQRSLKGAWGIVALPTDGFVVSIVVPVNEKMPIGGSTVVLFDSAGAVIRKQELATPLFVAEADEEGALWAYDNQPYSRVMRFPPLKHEAH